jgi:hypothetical protein
MCPTAAITTSITEQLGQDAAVHRGHLDVEQFGNCWRNVEVPHPFDLLASPNSVTPRQKDAVEFRVAAQIAV